MKPHRAVALFALALAAALPAAPAPARDPGLLFSCRIGARTATVTADGPRLIYRFGPARRPEITIVAGRTGGGVFYRRERYVEWEEQLRFTRGDYSYILYSMAANPHADSSAISGLVVLRGTNRVSDQSCARHASFTFGYDYEGLPQDSETFTAM